jgi:hypothetical protein
MGNYVYCNLLIPQGRCYTSHHALKQQLRVKRATQTLQNLWLFSKTQIDIQVWRC